MNTGREDVVVVGLDGSYASVSALVHALRGARRSGDRVEVVTAWTWRDRVGADRDLVLARAARRGALRAQTAVVARATRLVEEAPRVSAVIIEGDAADVLLRASRDARRLVLGGSGSGRRLGRAGPSTGERCVREATSPVVVVPARSEEIHAHGARGVNGARGDSHVGA